MKRIYSILFITIFVACDENLMPDVTLLNLGFKAVDRSSVPEKKSFSQEGGGIFIDTAIIVLEKIDLKMKEAAEIPYDPDEFMFRGPYEINLITGISKPELQPAAIAPGIYNTLYAELTVPRAYYFSIYVTGTYTLNEKWWRFIYEHNESGLFEVKSETGVVISGPSNNIWVMIDVVGLFKGIDFNLAEPDNSNVKVISSSSNTDLWMAVKNNFTGIASISDGDTRNPGNDSGEDEDPDENADNDSNADDDKDEDREADTDKEDDKDKDEDKDRDKDKDKDKDRDKDKDKDRDKDKDKDDDDDDDKNGDD